MRYPDPFEEEADSIIDSAIEAGHKIPESRREALVQELAGVLNEAWDECMQRAREAAHGK